MKAAIVAVGSEMLGSERLDTNSLRLAALLARYGVELRRKAVVGDDEADLVAEIDALLPAYDLIIVSGGLGPTADDLTRPAVAAALGRGISIDPEIVEWIAERFRRMGREMAAVNRRQAEVIDGATVLANDRGSAPGLTLTEGRATLFLFPGVPSELDSMCARYLEPWLAERTGGAALETVVLKTSCVAESTLEEWIAPCYEEFGREAITVLAKPGEVEVWATAAGDPAARGERLARMKARLAALLGDSLYAEGPKATLEATVGELLRKAGATLATAESCTGGLTAERLTRVPGSSDTFVGGVVAYSNRLKTELLGVPAELIAEHGAVSEPVARAMAEGARKRLGADYAIAITGVAGPGGGSPDKPVGTVDIAIAGPGDGEVEARRFRYPGDRERIRWISSQFALEMLRRRLARLPSLEL